VFFAKTIGLETGLRTAYYTSISRKHSVFILSGGILLAIACAACLEKVHSYSFGPHRSVRYLTCVDDSHQTRMLAIRLDRLFEFLTQKNSAELREVMILRIRSPLRACGVCKGRIFDAGLRAARRPLWHRIRVI